MLFFKKLDEIMAVNFGSEYCKIYQEKVDLIENSSGVTPQKKSHEHEHDHSVNTQKSHTVIFHGLEFGFDFSFFSFSCTYYDFLIEFREKSENAGRLALSQNTRLWL
jgi:hypothetical protein